MKILRFNKGNTPQRETGTASVYIHNSGSFCLNELAVKKMGIVLGEEAFIEVIQDEENPKDWYFVISTPELGFKLRKEKSTDKHGFNSGLIANAILKTLPKAPPPANTSPLTASLQIGAEPVEDSGLTLWPILTSSFKPKNK